MTAQMIDVIQTEKTRLRTEAAKRRDTLPVAERQAAAEVIAVRAFPVAVAPGVIVSGFMPLKSEINPLPLMQDAGEAGSAAGAARACRARQAACHARVGLRRAA